MSFSKKAAQHVQKTLASQEFKEYHAKQQAGRILLAQLLDYMEEEGISKSDLARATGMKQPSISRLLNGNRPDFRVSTLKMITDSLGLELEFKKVSS